MYYLRKETRETDGETYDRAIFKHSRFLRFYRGTFTGLDGRYQGMRVYTCKTLKNILKLRERLHTITAASILTFTTKMEKLTLRRRFNGRS